MPFNRDSTSNPPLLSASAPSAGHRVTRLSLFGCISVLASVLSVALPYKSAAIIAMSRSHHSGTAFVPSAVLLTNHQIPNRQNPYAAKATESTCTFLHVSRHDPGLARLLGFGIAPAERDRVADDIFLLQLQRFCNATGSEVADTEEKPVTIHQQFVKQLS